LPLTLYKPGASPSTPYVLGPTEAVCFASVTVGVAGSFGTPSAIDILNTAASSAYAVAPSTLVLSMASVGLTFHDDGIGSAQGQYGIVPSVAVEGSISSIPIRVTGTGYLVSSGAGNNAQWKYPSNVNGL
jgi:hypothetical protein